MANTAQRVATKKSTIDRSLLILRQLFRFAEKLSPELAGRAAERLFFTPGRARAKPDPELFGTARRLAIEVDGRPVAAWRWGHGPTVLLLHGWSGWGGQMAAFVEPLLARGFSVVAIDAPGHGASGRRRSSAPQFAAAVRAVAARTGPLTGLVAHSLGAAGATLALTTGSAVGRLVLLAPAANPPAWIPPFAARLGLSERSIARLRAHSERRIGLSWDDLHVPTLLGRESTPLLVIHDRDDREVPWSDGAAIAAARVDAEFLTTTGLGHVRLLRDSGVVEAVADFLSRGANRCGGCGAPLGGPNSKSSPESSSELHCHRCRLEMDLFDPATRWIESAELAPRALSLS